MNICNKNCQTCTIASRSCAFQNTKNQYRMSTEFTYDFATHSRPTTMLLGVTNNCNLACPYCFVHQNEQRMSFEVADQAIQWLKTNAAQKGENPLVGFFGGEPLLEFDRIIQPLVTKYYDDVRFCITTNGTLLNEDVVDFLRTYQIDPLLSFDGPAIVQNQQRPGKSFNSFNTVLTNIPYLLIRFPNTVMRATITKESIPYIYETVLMAVELGFKQITFCPNAYEDWDKDIENQLAEQFFQVGLYIYKELQAGNLNLIKVNPICKTYNRIKAAIQGDLKFNNSILRCGLGTTTCAVTPNGDIIPCQEKISHPTVVLGNVYTGIDPKQHESFLKDYFSKINNINCDKGCNLRSRLLCIADLCPSRLEDLNFQISSSYCAFERAAERTAARLQLLCDYSDKKWIANYFNSD